MAKKDDGKNMSDRQLIMDDLIKKYDRLTKCIE